MAPHVAFLGTRTRVCPHNVWIYLKIDTFGSNRSSATTFKNFLIYFGNLVQGSGVRKEKYMVRPLCVLLGARIEMFEPILAHALHFSQFRSAVV